MKKPSTPLIILVGCLVLLLNICIQALVLSLPYIQRFAKALYRGARAYLKACLVVVEDKSKAYAYYCLPVEDEGLIDTFCKVFIADISFTMANLGRLGSRICE